jgi:membrane protease YdiL (CAAX protease family)
MYLLVPDYLFHSETRTDMKRQFSIGLYLFIVILLSWPFQFWFVFKAEAAFDKYLYSSLSMVMVAAATFIAGRFVFKDGFANAGWSWGKPKHYIYVFAFALFVWFTPSMIELFFGLHKPADKVAAASLLAIFALRFAATLPAAFGEEFGWRGYMLPRLTAKYGAKKALLIHAFIWWFWHLPVLVGMGLNNNDVSDNQLINVAVISAVSIIPSMLHAVIFAFIWSKTKSLAVVTVYHAAFDEVRDTLEHSIGFGPLVNNWQMIVIIITGGLLLWKANWKKLLNNAADSVKPQSILLNKASANLT